MSHMSAHIPLYEDDEEPKQYRFVRESIWEENDVNNEDCQMA